MNRAVGVVDAVAVLLVYEEVKKLTDGLGRVPLRVCSDVVDLEGVLRERVVEGDGSRRESRGEIARSLDDLRLVLTVDSDDPFVGEALDNSSYRVRGPDQVAR